MGNETQAEDQEFAECDASARTVRFVAETHGAVWDTRRKVTPDGRGSRVQFTLAAHTPSTLKSLLFSLMSGVFREAMNKQVPALKGVCEGGAPRKASP